MDPKVDSCNLFEKPLAHYLLQTLYHNKTPSYNIILELDVQPYEFN